MPDAPEGEEIPEVTEIDELQTFIGNKKNKVWVWTRAHPRPVPSANPEGSGLRSRLWRFAPPWSDATHRVNHWQPAILLWSGRIRVQCQARTQKVQVCGADFGASRRLGQMPRVLRTQPARAYCPKGCASRRSQ